MQEISTADGFMEVNDCLAEMINYLANEPSLGLFFVQQHTQNAVPNLLSAKDKLVEKCREVTFETEDLEDSINMVKSITKCGFAIADSMNTDIKRSLLAMSRSKPKKGLISDRSFNFSMSRSSSWGPAAFNNGPGSTQQDSGSSYFSTVLNSAKQKAAALKWPPVDITQLTSSKGDMFVSSLVPSVPVVAEEKVSDTECEELPLSSELVDEPIGEELQPQDVLSAPENYEKFKSEQEAKLEQWLEDDGNQARENDVE